MLFWIRILSLLPLPILYGLADCLLYPIMYYVVRYRRAIVHKNIRLSFPHKTDDECRRLEKKFYHHFADTIVEIIYGYRISDSEMHKRLHIEGIDMVQGAIQKTGGVFLLMGHLGNWEWTAELAKRYTDSSIMHYNVYRRLKNESSDKAMLALRAKRGGEGCIEKNLLLRRLVALRHEGRPISIGLISDQKPSPHSAHVWTTFLNQDTAFLNGAEVLARKFGYAVVYIHINCTRRGFYEARCELITDDPKSTSDGEITLTFAHLLEENILEQPELWLWSHNRWKWSKPATTQLESATT